MSLSTNNQSAITLGVVRNDLNFSESVSQKLKDFGLDYSKHIISTTIPTTIKTTIPDQQQCYSNALHLAVSDVLFERFSFPSNQSESSSDSESEFEVYSKRSNLNANVQKIISEVRETVKLFTKHPFNNQVLQEFIVQAQGEQMPLVLSSNTKWNTIESMLNVFIKLYDCICSALRKLNKPTLNVKVDVLDDLLKSLKPITLSITALDNKDANLLTAEGILEFLLESLSEENLSYCFAFKEAIKRRIKECRNDDLVELMTYLTQGVCPDEPNTRDKLCKVAYKLIQRLWSEDELEVFKDESKPKTNLTNSEQIDEDVIMDPLERRLKAAINNSIRRSISKPEKITRFQRLQNDFATFEHSMKLSPDLTRLLEVLNTIKPSCTVHERAFKVPSHLCPMKRYNGLEFLNIRIFLRGFFENN